MTVAGKKATWMGYLYSGNYQVRIKTQQGTLIDNDIMKFANRINDAGNYLIELNFETMSVTTHALRLSSIENPFIGIGQTGALHSCTASGFQNATHSINYGEKFLLGAQSITRPVSGNTAVKLKYTMQTSPARSGDIDLMWIADHANGSDYDSKWDATASVDLAEGLPPGTYPIDFYFEAADGMHTVVKQYNGNTKYRINLQIKDAGASLPTIVTNASANRNYIRTITPLDATGNIAINSSGQVNAGAGVRTLVEIQYYDGLGRPDQLVRAGATPTRNDIVVLQEYDSFGRESKSWLPLHVSTNSGSYREPATLKSQTYSAYNNVSDSLYSRPTYENSPLNRIIEQYGPGKEWYQNGKSVKTSFHTNVQSSGDGDFICGKYSISSSDMLQKSGDYATGRLYVTRVEDEDGNTAYEFKDKLGQIVLTRQINDGERYDTYYIYDDFGNLTGVLPPLLSEQYENADSTQVSVYNDSECKNYGYFYRYDHRNRCVQKKLPGAEWIYYVYDKADRLILSQDGEQRANDQWVFYIYDVFGRVVLSGLHKQKSGKDFVSLTISINSAVIVESPDPNDNECRGYTWNTLYGILGHTATADFRNEILLVNYYDNYELFTGAGCMKGFFAGGEGDQEAQPAGYAGTVHASATGLLTGRLDYYQPEAYLPTVWYYDYRGRVVQQRSRPPMGLDVEFTDYDFGGQPLRRKLVHTKNNKTYTEEYLYEYDHTGRLKRTKHQIDAQTPVVLAEHTYDEIGRLKETRMANTNKLKTTYTYNVRSWLKTSANTLFEQTLYYNDGSTSYYNGNISKNEWGYSGTKRKLYEYTYDNLSRLKNADYFQINPTSAERYESFNVSYQYDKQGNVTSLQRKRTWVNPETMDNLSMEYVGNQLCNVEESGDLLEGFIGYTTGFEQQFAYNASGAVKKDRNKKATYSYHPYNNMPLQVSVNNLHAKGLNIYEYTATGQKLSKRQYYDPDRSILPLSGTGTLVESDFKNGGYPVKETRYESNMLFENYALKQILTENGYIKDGKYYFYIKDHLGGNRAVASQSGEEIQRTDTYPYGMPYATNTGEEVQPYTFGGKEYDAMHCLNLYDFHARQQDPELGRFLSMDPLAEKAYSWSPYAYCFGNPVNRIDPDGQWGWLVRAIPYIVEGIGYAVAVINGAIITYQHEKDIEKSSKKDDGSSSTPQKSEIKRADHAEGGNTEKSNSESSKENNSNEPKKGNNPDGAKGKPDHQAKVKELADKAKSENQGKDIVTEKKIKTEGSNRRPDVQVVDPKTGKTTKVYEAERNPNSTRNKNREAEYKKLGIDYETHKVGN